MRKRRLRVSEDGPTAITDGTTDPSRHIGSNHYPVMALAEVTELETESVFDAQHELDLTETALEIVRTQLDNLDTAREAADELIEALLFDAGPRRFRSSLRSPVRDR
jgi:hypothetical protein